MKAEPLEDDRFARAIELFDAANAEDPTRVLDDGQEVPAAVLYARRMTARLARFAPDAPEVVRLAVRAQHLGRWKLPRDAFPPGREGYLRWRTQAARRHAADAAEILRAAGYDEATAERVGQLIRKQRLRTDREAQLVEDVACLVFIEHYLADFAAGIPPEMTTSILQRTWSKMSPRARQAALDLPLPPETRTLLDQALTPA